jgi:hypothetical protein
LHLPQLALSHQIGALDRELGTPVLERLPLGVRPTAAARAAPADAHGAGRGRASCPHRPHVAAAPVDRAHREGGRAGPGRGPRAHHPQAVPIADLAGLPVAHYHPHNGLGGC